MAANVLFNFDMGWLAAVFLLSLRLAAIFLMTPLLYAMSIPPSVRVLFVIALSAALLAGLPDVRSPLIPGHDFLNNLGFLMFAAFSELALGATMALSILLAFAAFTIAGRLLDIQIGFGIAQVFDPITRTQIPVITSAFNMLAAIVFFLVNGHHALLRGIAYSLEHFPLGQPWAISQSAGPLMKQVAGLFSLGFALAAPVVFCVLLAEVALGVIARNLPQMNMFAMGLPVKIVVGLVALSFWFAGMGDVMSRTYASIYTTWGEMFAANKPPSAEVP